MKICKIAYRKKCEDQFEYGEEIRSMWREILHKEKDRVRQHRCDTSSILQDESGHHYDPCPGLSLPAGNCGVLFHLHTPILRLRLYHCP